MKEINLYLPGKIDALVQFPQEWNELEPEELELISKQFITPYKEAHLQKAAIFIVIIDYRAKKANLDTDIHQFFDAEDVAINGLSLIDFLYKDNTLSNQPYPVIELPGFGKVFGPESHFDNLITGEFEEAEIRFLNFSNEPNLEENGKIHLAQLAAILYRPKDQPFITYDVASDENKMYDSSKFEKLFLELPPEQLYLIFIWYNGCRKLLPKIFRTCFESAKEQSEPDLLAFTKCVHAAAGIKNGNRDKVRRTLLKALFFDMEQEAIKAKELKAEYERNK